MNDTQKVGERMPASGGGGAGAPVFVVAIDGPAGSGKSSVSKAVAGLLGFAYLDTGAVYRALTWLALRRRVEPGDPDALAALLAAFRDVRIDTDPADYRVRVAQTDVTDEIRTPEVTGRVSALARVPAVREHVNGLFRRLIAETARPGIIVEGRDITTVVAPDAPVRLLLTADAAVRAARRVGELAGAAGRDAAGALHRRDAADSRVVDFMNAADGVATLDSTRLDFAATVAAVRRIVVDARAATQAQARAVARASAKAQAGTPPHAGAGGAGQSAGRRPGEAGLETNGDDS
ncbi:MAG TPA: (d)CMP kinase [Microbacteriaceae bacterium]|nr:(d)CMP kinase [Microbacteriaceae bacterium]